MSEAQKSESRTPPVESGPLSPNDHVRMLIELMRPAGPELARRWVAALTLVPEAERESVVEAVERRIVDEYARSDVSAS